MNNPKYLLLRLMESNPDRWFRKLLRPLYDEALEELASFVGSDPANLVFVQNVTSAVNIIVKALDLGPEDIVLSNSHTYESCRFAIDSAVKKSGADSLCMDISFPIEGEDDLVDQVVQTCKKNVSVKLVIIDHISSPSAIVFPVQKICIELKKLGVLVLVDGAHAPGQIALNLEELGADFYTGNLHKWCYAPRGSAFLWVSPDMQGQIEPLVTSHLYGQSMADQFFMQGTADHTAYLCTKTGLQFYRQFGGLPALLDHTQALLDWAAEMLVEAFRTEQLQVPRNMQAPCMRVIR